MRALKEKLVVADTGECEVEFQNYQLILEDELKQLNEKERKAIFLRFWATQTIAQIATELCMSWEATDILIDYSVAKLREGFRRHKYYKRTPNSQGEV